MPNKIGRRSREHYSPLGRRNQLKFHRLNSAEDKKLDIVV
jgi:hypothetical protein